mmetsp:Transcript_97520/g.163965  ORF Transcript_97520/g.163965 Transcript_97520/m.163965 type:complete len:88 (-) Transcript_97520:336-599(-)
MQCGMHVPPLVTLKESLTGSPFVVWACGISHVEFAMCCVQLTLHTRVTEKKECAIRALGDGVMLTAADAGHSLFHPPTAKDGGLGVE